MMKPEDIPEDAWRTAEMAWQKASKSSISPVRVIAYFIMAARGQERERCAAEASRLGFEYVAIAIRKGSAATHHEIRDLGEFVAERKGRE